MSLEDSRRRLVDITHTFEVNNNFLKNLLSEEIVSFNDEEREKANSCEISLSQLLDSVGNGFEKSPVFMDGVKAASRLSYATGGEQSLKEQYIYSVVLLVLFLWDDIVSDNKALNREELYLLAESFSLLISDNVVPSLEDVDVDILNLAKLLKHIDETHVGLLKGCQVNKFIRGTIRDKDVPSNLEECWSICEMSCYRGILNCFLHLLNRQNIQFSVNSEVCIMCYKMICIINDYSSYKKELEEGCCLNTIIVREKSHHDGTVFMKNYFQTLVVELEEKIDRSNKDGNLVILSWVLGYLRFEKNREDMRNRGIDE